MSFSFFGAMMCIFGAFWISRSENCRNGRKIMKDSIYKKKTSPYIQCPYPQLSVTMWFYDCTCLICKRLVTHSNSSGFLQVACVGAEFSHVLKIFTPQKFLPIFGTGQLHVRKNAQNMGAFLVILTFFGLFLPNLKKPANEKFSIFRQSCCPNLVR